MKNLTLPKTATAKCVLCDEIQETTWNKYGSLLPCIACDAAPADLVLVSA